MKDQDLTKRHRTSGATQVKKPIKKKSEAILRSLVSMGSKIAGGTVALAANSRFALPELGVILASVVAVQLERIGNEHIAKRLAPRQEARVGRAFVLAAARLKEREQAGETPRDDGFFDRGEMGRSSADEVWEAVLFAAMNSAQEKKIDFISMLMVNIAFDKTIEVGTAHMLVDLAQSLTFRSFVLLKVFGEIENAQFSARLGMGSTKQPEPSLDLQPIMIETFGLVTRGLLEKHERLDPENVLSAILGWGDVDPALMRLNATGKLLYRALELSTMAVTDSDYLLAFNSLERVSTTGQSSNGAI